MDGKEQKGWRGEVGGRGIFNKSALKTGFIAALFIVAKSWRGLFVFEHVGRGGLVVFLCSFFREFPLSSYYFPLFQRSFHLSGLPQTLRILNFTQWSKRLRFQLSRSQVRVWGREYYSNTWLFWKRGKWKLLWDSHIGRCDTHVDIRHQWQKEKKFKKWISHFYWKRFQLICDTCVLQES